MWKEHFGPVGAAEAWISSNKITPPPAWLTAEEIATHTKILAQKGYVGPLNWYVTFRVVVLIISSRNNMITHCFLYFAGISQQFEAAT